MKLSAETLLVLADGKKAVFFRNQGFNGQVRLKPLQRFDNENLASHEMGWDRAGRSFARVGMRRSAYEIPDYHEVEEARFLEDLAQAIEFEMSQGQFFKLVIMAPPRALGLLRESLTLDTLDKVMLVLPKDYLNTPISDLEEILTRGLH
jgi:protein required for attachment to host cells